MHKYIFTDTNLFEQYQPIANIDWQKLADCEKTTLVVCSVVLGELNRHKDTAARGRIKRRANLALSELSGYARLEIPANVRPGVEIQFRHQEPLLDFSQYRLSEEVPDDRLLASAIEFSEEHDLPDGAVMIATGDLGLELKTKAQQKLSVLILPPELRLPDEPDAEEAQIKDLQNQIRLISSALPRLDITFDNDSHSVRFAVEGPLSLDEAKVKEELAQLRCKFPLQVVSPQPLVAALIGPQEISRYNMELIDFYKRTGHYYSEVTEYLNRQRLSIQLRFVLHNDGGAPADDVDIEMHIPDGLTVLNEDEPEKEPKEPKPPAMPGDRYAGLDLSFAAPRFDLPDLTPAPFANSRLKGVRKTNSYLVNFAVERLKHTMSEDLPPVLARFDSFDAVKPFQIEYRIVAANLPTPATGRLNVIAGIT